MDYAGRRQYSEDTATDIYYEEMAFRWPPNGAKLFFNLGVAAHGSGVCANSPPTAPSLRKLVGADAIHPPSKPETAIDSGPRRGTG
jgi:hypothetical protein